MAVMRVQVALERDSLLPEDVVTNTWHFTTQENADPGRLTNITDAIGSLELFYVDIDAFLGSTLTGVYTITAYDLADPEPRAPVVTVVGSVVPGLNSLPGETAITMSFQGDQISGVSQARRRGRVFLGTIASSTAQESLGTVRPDQVTRDGIAAAGQTLLDASELDVTWSWIVFSPTTAGPENPNGTFPNLAGGVVVVTNGWVDDAYDTIRSRGVAPASRVVFT